MRAGAQPSLKVVDIIVQKDGGKAFEAHVTYQPEIQDNLRSLALLESKSPGHLPHKQCHWRYV